MNRPIGDRITGSRLAVWTVLLFCLAVVALPQEIPVHIRITVQIANVRSTPESGSSVVGQFKIGDVVVATAKVANWYAITVLAEDGKPVTGYIHESIVEIVPAVEYPLPKNQVSTTDLRRDQPKIAQPVKRGVVKLLGGVALTDIAETGNPLTTGWTHRWKSTYLGGVGFEIGGSRLFLEMGVFYFPSGVSRSRTEPIDDQLTFTYASKLLTFPLLLKYKFKKGVTPFLSAGGEAGFVLSHRMQVSSAEVEGEYDLLETINRLYYGAVFGGGIEIPLGRAALQLEGRFHLGLSNQWLDPVPEESLKLRALVGLVSFRF